MDDSFRSLSIPYAKLRPQSTPEVHMAGTRKFGVIIRVVDLSVYDSVKKVPMGQAKRVHLSKVDCIYFQ